MLYFFLSLYKTASSSLCATTPQLQSSRLISSISLSFAFFSKVADLQKWQQKTKNGQRPNFFTVTLNLFLCLGGREIFKSFCTFKRAYTSERKPFGRWSANITLTGSKSRHHATNIHTGFKGVVGPSGFSCASSRAGFLLLKGYISHF